MGPGREVHDGGGAERIGKEVTAVGDPIPGGIRVEGVARVAGDRARDLLDARETVAILVGAKVAEQAVQHPGLEVCEPDSESASPVGGVGVPGAGVRDRRLVGIREPVPVGVEDRVELGVAGTACAVRGWLRRRRGQGKGLDPCRVIPVRNRRLVRRERSKGVRRSRRPRPTCSSTSGP